MAKHSPRFLKIVDEARKHIREVTVDDVKQMLDRGELSHNVAQTFALDDIVAAHEAVESGKTAGNVVVRMR